MLLPETSASHNHLPQQTNQPGKKKQKNNKELLNITQTQSSTQQKMSTAIRHTSNISYDATFSLNTSPSHNSIPTSHSIIKSTNTSILQNISKRNRKLNKACENYLYNLFKVQIMVKEMETVTGGSTDLANHFELIQTNLALCAKLPDFVIEQFALMEKKSARPKYLAIPHKKKASFEKGMAQLRIQVESLKEKLYSNKELLPSHHCWQWLKANLWTALSLIPLSISLAISYFMTLAQPKENDRADVYLLNPINSIFLLENNFILFLFFSCKSRLAYSTQRAKNETMFYQKLLSSSAKYLDLCVLFDLQKKFEKILAM